MTFSYPYAASSYNLRVEPSGIFNSTDCTSAFSFSTSPLSSSAQFFVAMGVLSMIYVVGALLVYVLFITPELFMAKWLVLGVRGCGLKCMRRVWCVCVSVGVPYLVFEVVKCSNVLLLILVIKFVKIWSVRVSIWWVESAGDARP